MRKLSNALALAQQLGATVFSCKGEGIVNTLLQFAKACRVGHIVIGAPAKKAPWRRGLRGKASIAERLISQGSGITLVVLC